MSVEDDKSVMPFNRNGKRHGYWKIYNGNLLWWTGKYINGEHIGYHFHNCKNSADKLNRADLIEKNYFIR